MDNELAKSRRTVLAVPNFNRLGSLLAGTDIITTVPDYTAGPSLAASGGLRIEEHPLSLPPGSTVDGLARGAQETIPEKWLRSRITMFVGDEESSA